METKDKKSVPKGEKTTHIEPKRLSKFAIWRKNNPDGIFVIVDRKAVMK